MNQIILFNEFHIGDVFFSVEIVRNIVKCNPNVNVFIMNKYNAYYLFSNIINKKLLTPTRYNKNNISWEIKDNIVLINMWCAGGGIRASDIDSFSQQNRIIKIIKQINENNINLNLEYKPLTKNELIPRLNLSTIPISIQNKIDNYDKCIFYYNVTPLSGQYKGHIINHDKNIFELCDKFKQYSIIVPKTTQKEYSNLICLDKSGIIEKWDAENVVQYAQIAKKCNHVILLDCGACFLSLVDNNNQLYILDYDSIVSFSDLMNNKISYDKLSKKNILDKELIRIII